MRRLRADREEKRETHGGETELKRRRTKRWSSLTAETPIREGS
jgi:hypothetical protein